MQLLTYLKYLWRRFRGGVWVRIAGGWIHLPKSIDMRRLPEYYDIEDWR
jgi:hypothetical protein